MIGFSLRSKFQVRLPNLNIHIRDKLNSIKEQNISSIYIYEDSEQIENKVNLTNNSKNAYR